MKFSIAFALLPLLGSAYARPTITDSVARRDGYEADKGHRDDGKDYDRGDDKSHRDDGKDYDREADKHHYPDNLSEYPNKHCDVRYQNFIDLLLDDVCAKFYQGDRKHDDRKHTDDQKHRRDGKDYGRDDSKKDDGRDDKKHDDGRDQHKEVKECDDRADKLLEEACRAYYHYDGGKKEEHKDEGKDREHKEEDKYRDDGKKGDEHHQKDEGKKDDGRYPHDDGKKDDERRY